MKIFCLFKEHPGQHPELLDIYLDDVRAAEMECYRRRQLSEGVYVEQWSISSYGGSADYEDLDTNPEFEKA